MDNLKKYTIQINGIEESIDAVDSLNKALQALDKKIKDLDSRSVNLTTKGGGSTSKSSSRSSSSGLNEEEKLQRQIAELEQKRIVHEKEIYQNYLAQKELLKEIDEDQKDIAAKERLQANAYSNTIKGMKQELADIKQALQTVDLGDTKELDKMTKRANELNESLKKIEQSYGQFGRNVGNYKSAADGFKGLRIEVAGTVHEFDNSRQALRALQTELRTLQVKSDQGVILSDEEVQRFKELPSIVAQIQSSIQDAGRPMDSLMDTMKSFVAIAQVGEGAGAFFGIDEEEVERSIQKLVGLQNAMQGLQTINEQLRSKEFMGGMLQKANSMIDSFTTSLLGAKNAIETVSDATDTATDAIDSTKNATEAAANATEAAANVTQTTAKATEGLTTATNLGTKATKSATLASKALSLALKGLGIGLIISLVAALVTYWDDLTEAVEEAIPAVKDIGKWFDKLVQILSGVGTALFSYIVTPFSAVFKAISAMIDGKGIKDVWKTFTTELKNGYDVVGNYQKGANKALQNQQDRDNKERLKKQKEANKELEKDAEAKYGKDYARSQKYFKDQMALIDKELKYAKKGSDKEKELLKEKREYERDLWKSERSERDENRKKAAESTKKLNEEERKLLKARAENMKDGLDKELALLDIAMQEELKDVKSGSELYNEIVKKYADERLKVTKEYTKKTTEAHEKMWNTINEMSNANRKRELSNEATALKQEQEKMEASLSSGTSKREYRKQETFISTDYEIVRESDIAYTNSLAEQYKKRTEDARKYFEDNTRIQTEYENKRHQNALSASSIELNDAVIAARNDVETKIKSLDEKLLSEEEYQDAVKKIREEGEIAVANITQQYALKDEEENRKHQQNNIKIAKDGYKEIIDNYKSSIDAFKNIDSSQPLNNAFGLISVDKVKQRNNAIVENFKTTVRDIDTTISQLEQKLNSSDITEEERRSIQALIDELNKLKAAANGSITTTLTNTQKLVQDARQQTMEVIQAAQTAVQGIMDALSTVWDAQFDAEREALDKELEMAEERYSQMDELAQEHASNMETLEDEIAKSQGDARDRLIARYMAEKEAQKKATEEKKKAAKEEEKLKLQQEELEKERQKRQQQMNIAQAIMNTGVAITMAAMTPWPASLAFIAQAIAVGAMALAQIASVQFKNGGQLPSTYATGGVIQGHSHAQGGVKVLGGSVEVEGGEFITNKRTTNQNVEVLEYINSQHKRLSLDDFVDFYGGRQSNVRKVIASASPRSRYADGGILTSPIANVNTTESRILDAIERYANRQTVVSVQEIIDRTDDVRSVQVLAGLSD